MRSIVFGAVLCALVSVGCGSATDDNVEYPFKLDIENPAQRRVLELQDKQHVDSLSMLMTDPDPTIRYRAAMAFASIRDSTVIHALGNLLNDEHPKVRYAAAYALGQTGASQAEAILINGFDPLDSLRLYTESNSAILEAVGKTGTQQSLQYLNTIKTYQVEDSLLILGQARGVYRFALRGFVEEGGTKLMVDLLESTHLPRSIRIVAANYLFRAAGIQTGEHLPTLIPIFNSERDPEIRMCIATAIGKSGDPDALRVFKNRFRQERDYRVKCNILRALRYFEYRSTHDFAMQATGENNLHVARTAARYLASNGDRTWALDYRSVSRGQLPWEVKAVLYWAANKYLPMSYTITKTNMHAELEAWFKRSPNGYERAEVLTAIGAEPTRYREVKTLGFADESFIVKTTAVRVLAQLAADEQLDQQVGATAARTMRQDLAGYLLEAVETGDPAMIAEAAGGLRVPALRSFVSRFEGQLTEALNALELPRDIETYNALASAIADVKGEKFEPKSIGYNHPIEWDLLAGLRDTVQAEIITSRGTIVADLYTSKAPGTVANFVALSRDRFYHNKNFHRVVPNFVIQGGCPRGDGYGSLDYTIRSELGPLFYDNQGYLGMASAGNHTECTQWFVTHSPTPHLDGNYTIFGKVRSGMDVVHNIQIGDVIKEVNIGR